ncbi:MAG: GDSL-type esterase/lipase family protein [Thermincolia bacterium]
MDKPWVKKTLLLILVLLTLIFILVPMTGADTTKSYYLALGDSLTVGYQSPQETMKAGNSAKKFVDIYFDRIKPYFNNLEKMNHGKIGISSSQLRKDVLDNRDLREKIKQASVITVTIGGNDLLKQGLEIVLTGKEAQVEKSREQMAKNLTETLVEIRKLTKAPVYVSDIYNPFNPKRWQHKKLEPWVQKFNRTIYDIAWEQKVKVAPVYETFQGHEIKKKESFIGHDALHPNDNGYTAISEAFWRVTKNDLPKE